MPQEPPTINPDYPDADGTDAAHPAWWRGHDAGALSVCERIRKVLDGKDKGVMGEPLESIRREIISLIEEVDGG